MNDLRCVDHYSTLSEAKLECSCEWVDIGALDWTARIIGMINVIVNPRDEMLRKLPVEHQFIYLFMDLFTMALPLHQPYNYSIELVTGESAPWGPIYSLWETELQVLREYLDKMARKGKDCTSKSHSGALILFLPNRNRGLRLCVDYQGFKNVGVKDTYTIPLMSELRDRVQGATIFMKLDLWEGYHLIRMKGGD